MNRARPGQDGRPNSAARMPPLALLPLLALLASVGPSCSPGDASPRDRAEGIVAAEPRALAPPAGRASAVESLCWGGFPADRLLGARFDDGRFALYRPRAGSAPISVGLVAPGRGRLSGLAITGPDRAVSGDGLGLVLWDTSDAMARPIDRVDCGAVGAVEVEPIGPNDLLIGLDDGRLVRFRPDRSRIGPPRAETRSTGRAPGVRALGFLDNGRSILVFRSDGRCERQSRQLDQPGERIGPALAAAETKGVITRILGPGDDGPALVASGPDGLPLWRFPLPAEGVDLAGVLGGDGLIVACEHRVLLMRPLPGAPPRPSEVRGLPAEGPTRVAADPADPEGRRIALADAAGRLIVYDARELARSAAPVPLDNAADLAFRPHRRAHHPRNTLDGDSSTSTSTSTSTSKRLAERIDDARRMLDRGDIHDLRTIVRELESDPALDRDAAADVAILAAAVKQETGWPDSAVRLSLAAARETFALRGTLDREADLRLWAGSLLIPPIDARDGSTNAARIEEALAEFRRAADLYRRAGPGLDRQARIAEAMAAWGLLALGRPREAQEVFGPVERAAEADPVLRQAPEFDRIAAALAIARGDWEAADLASDHLLRRLSPPTPDRQAMASEAALERVGDLASLGRWAEAASVLADDRPDDPEWTLRRATVRRRAGLDRGPIDPPPSTGSIDSPRSTAEVHVRGRVASADPDEQTRAEGVRFLALAAEAHRRADRADLAIEADLERAEALERLQRFAEAAPLYTRVARTLAAEGDSDRIRGAARPIGFGAARAHRGLARCQLALGHPDRALGSLDQATLLAWFERSGSARVRASRLVAPRAGPDAPQLREARRAAIRSADTPSANSAAAALVRRQEVRLAAEHRELVLSDPARPFDPSTLLLSPGEAVLAFAVLGPESMAAFLIRPGAPIEARLLPESRTSLRRAARIWRSALGDDGRPCELDPPSGPDGLLSLAPEPDSTRVDPDPGARSNVPLNPSAGFARLTRRHLASGSRAAFPGRTGPGQNDGSPATLQGDRAALPANQRTLLIANVYAGVSGARLPSPGGTGPGPDDAAPPAPGGDRAGSPIDQRVNVVANVNATSDAPGPSADRPAGSILLDAMIGPFRSALDGVEHLIVIPDDSLASVPLEGLVTGADAARLPKLRFAPGLALLRRSRAEPRPDHTAPRSVLLASTSTDPVLPLALNAALSGTENRVEILDDPSRLSARLLLDDRPPGVLHLSAVGLLDPAYSSGGEPELLLANPDSTSTDRTRLSGTDILGLNLDGALVLLIIEHRPLPRVADPTCWRDLSANLLAAGARSVIITLWDPPADSSPSFASAFHRGLSRGLSPSAALAAARDALSLRPETADPVHWAGYLLYDLSSPSE